MPRCVLCPSDGVAMWNHHDGAARLNKHSHREETEDTELKQQQGTSKVKCSPCLSSTAVNWDHAETHRAPKALKSFSPFDLFETIHVLVYLAWKGI